MPIETVTCPFCSETVSVEGGFEGREIDAIERYQTADDPRAQTTRDCPECGNRLTIYYA